MRESKKSLFPTLLCILLLTLGACNQSKNTDTQNPINTNIKNKANTPSTSTSIFDQPEVIEEVPPKIKQIFISKCSPCHTSEETQLPNWLNYKTAYAKKDIIKSRVIDNINPNKPMPPAGMPPLTESEKKILANWIFSGAPPDTTTKNPNSPPSIPVGTPLTYKELIYPYIIKNRCEQCHNALSNQKSTPDWALYNNVYEIKDKILVRVTKTKDMPPQGLPMSDQERDLIKRWIEEGAPQ